jgi:hypothetical protein
MMKKTYVWLGALLACQPLWAYDFKQVANSHIVPIYQQLEQATAPLANATQAYCESPNSANQAALKQQFSQGFLAWQGAQHLRFGPVQYLMREHRFALWPDKRGSVAKHLRRTLNSPVLQATDFNISQQSVAVQGFSAFEYLLYQSGKPSANECRLMQAIAANLGSMSNSLLADWVSGEHPHRDYFASPGSDNLVYESEEELAGILLNSLYTELELIVTQKLARPLDEQLDTAKPKRAEAWRSQNALPAIAANLTAIEALYQSAFAPKLGERPLAATIAEAFKASREQLTAIGLPLSKAVADSAEREQVLKLQRQLSQLKGLIGRDMAAALNLSLGFNSLDGD